jgi:hypothetical protein
MVWHSGDNRTENAVMLIGRTRALLFQAITSATRVAIVNVASFRMKGREWLLEETQGGPALAKEVRSLAAAIARTEKRTVSAMQELPLGSVCTGLTAP